MPQKCVSCQKPMGRHRALIVTPDELLVGLALRPVWAHKECAVSAITEFRFVVPIVVNTRIVAEHPAYKFPMINRDSSLAIAGGAAITDLATISQEIDAALDRGLIALHRRRETQSSKDLEGFLHAAAFHYRPA